MIQINNLDFITLKELEKELQNTIGELSYSRLKGLIREKIITNYQKIGRTIVVPKDSTVQQLQIRSAFIKKNGLIRKKINEYYGIDKNFQKILSNIR